MEVRTFDLTVPVTRAFRMIWTTVGVGWISCGCVDLAGNAILGAVQIVLGIGFLGLSGPLKGVNRFIVTLSDTNLDIRTGLFRHRKIQWTSVSRINIELMKLEFVLAKGRNIKIDFTALSYNDNQVIRPRIIEAVTAFAEAKGIPVQDGRSG